MGLTKKQRERRDELSAIGAIEMATRRDQMAGIAVDNDESLSIMVERVKSAATILRLEFAVEETEHADTGTYIRFAKGSVYVFAADKLIPPDRRTN